jgi:hypothetical protein
LWAALRKYPAIALLQSLSVITGLSSGSSLAAFCSWQSLLADPTIPLHISQESRLALLRVGSCDLHSTQCGSQPIILAL